MIGKGLLGQVPAALRPDSRRDIVQESRQLVRGIYKPVLTDIRAQERLTEGIYEKRTSDNQYYLDWLNTKSNELQAHAETADNQLTMSQTEIANAANQAMGQLQQRLLAQAGDDPGNVSNPTQSNAIMTDTTAQGAANAAMIAAERERTATQQRSAEGQRQAAQGSNFAYATAAQQRAGADYGLRMTELGTARTAAKQERASKIQEETVRRLDQEIAKAQSVVEMRNMAAQIALGLKQHRLGKAQLSLDEQIRQGELDLGAAELAEEIRSNQADEADADADRESEEQQADDERREGNQDDRREERQRQREIFHEIRDIQSTIGSRENLQDMIQDNPGGVVKWLQNHGFNALYAQAAVQLSLSGRLYGNVLRSLRQSGFQAGEFFPTGRNRGN
jgi:hypothetical protein